MVDIGKLINELVEHIESALAVDSDYVDCVRTDTLQTVVGLLKEQQPKKGKWKTVNYLSYLRDFKRCTCCGYICQGWDGETGVVYNYCPDCGAEMENGDINRKRAENPIITALKERYREDGEQE